MKGSNAFHVMVKPIGSVCNMDCKYCFYLEKENLYPENKNLKMNDSTLETFIRDYINSIDIPTVNFTWQGGEPTLLGVDYFERIVKLQKKYSSGKIIQNSFQTNGLLLNDEWCSFFAANDFLVGVSIDGPSEINNKYRYYKGGQNSFAKVLEGLEYLQKYKVEFNTLTCVSKANQNKPLEVYNFLKSIGSKYIQFIPVVERAAKDEKESLRLVKPKYPKTAEVTKWSVDPVEYGNFLITIFDNWVRNDVAEVFIQTFDVALESFCGYKQSLCVFNKTCGNAIALEHNGDLYSCDHYVYPGNKLGNIINENISSLVYSEDQIVFGNDKLNSLPKYCLDCEVRFACNGECPKHRFDFSPYGEYGLNYLCVAYKKFFNHINPFMKFMVTELNHNRPPANVMEWIKLNDKNEGNK
ncbi:MAG: anaerobic sulfatase maturase [Ignavibacteriae bacterium HGW-Ignavibacteriae-2]|jgi:uncharacterized protein|nr:MAG: anaerobic sulfatase maturase [Ignavibacteriae bacterium HGW-Ignavibacteriae-2]